MKKRNRRVFGVYIGSRNDEKLRDRDCRFGQREGPCRSMVFDHPRIIQKPHKNGQFRLVILAETARIPWLADRP